MNIIKYPLPEQWNEILKRPSKNNTELGQIVNDVLKDVKENGDEALIRYELKFDHVALDSLKVSNDEFNEADSLISDDLKSAIQHAYKNIGLFHKSQVNQTNIVQTDLGVSCWRKALPIQKVGLYVPGGTAPLFSTVIMLATPATIAGCKDIVLCTPPNKNGKIHPAILYAAKISGVSEVFKIGGIQAIAAMAYGTLTVPKVYKIFGPGNQYVMAAKQAVSLSNVAIDMPAGPSEVAIVANNSSNADFIAADLLSQAEHGIDSQVLLISDDLNIINNVIASINIQIEELPRKDIAMAALSHSRFILVHDMDEAIDLANAYAPEHLILAIDNYESLADKVVNAGSVFLGPYSCESAGDYASGTNHTLPTNGYANMYSGVSCDSFIKNVTFQNVTKDGVLSLAKTVEEMAHNEFLHAHEYAMKIRREYIENL